MSIDNQCSDHEGGHMSCMAGRVVRTPGAAKPYKVVMTRHRAANRERAFDTVRECEAFIRRNTPVPASRSTLYDRSSAGQVSAATFCRNGLDI
jgi:hypothetical protein